MKIEKKGEYLLNLISELELPADRKTAAKKLWELKFELRVKQDCLSRVETEDNDLILDREQINKIPFKGVLY